MSELLTDHRAVVGPWRPNDAHPTPRLIIQIIDTDGDRHPWLYSGDDLSSMREWSRVLFWREIISETKPCLTCVSRGFVTVSCRGCRGLGFNNTTQKHSPAARIQQWSQAESMAVLRSVILAPSLQPDPHVIPGPPDSYDGYKHRHAAQRVNTKPPREEYEDFDVLGRYENGIDAYDFMMRRRTTTRRHDEEPGARHDNMNNSRYD